MIEYFELLLRGALVFGLGLLSLACIFIGFIGAGLLVEFVKTDLLSDTGDR
jgi:hypothetical protein